MPLKSDPFSEKKKFYYAIFIPVIIGILMTLSFLLEQGMDWDFHTGGIFPRRIENIWGIFTIIFIHASWEHLINNLIAFLILGTLLYYFYSELATKVLIISYICSGFILWIIGRENWHVGASGLIYSIAFFLFFSGIIRKHIPLIAISLIVAFVYGSMIWHIFPWQIQDPVSWEGHLAGGITGFVLSIILRKAGPQKPVETWLYEDDIDDENSIEYVDLEENEENN